MSERSPRFLLWLGLAAFVVLGMPEAVQGTVWPFMRSDLSRPLADLGVLVSAGTLSFVLAATMVAKVLRKAGLGRTIAVALALRLIGFVGIATADQWWMIVGAAAILGFGGGWLDPAINIDFALHHGFRAMGLLHAMFGVGATIGPLLVVSVLPQWRPAFWVLAIAQTVILVVVLANVSAWRKLPPSEFTATRRSVRWQMLGGFFLYTGIEVAGGEWAFSLLFEGRGLSETTAGAWVAMYWGGLTVGRLAVGAIGDRIGLRRLIDWSIGTAILGMAVLWVDPAGLGSLGLPIAGLGLASLFPGFVSMTPRLAGASGTDSAVGSQLAAAGLGAASLPWLAGKMAETNTLEVIPPLLVLGLVLLGVGWATMSRKEAPAIPERAATTDAGRREHR